MTGNENGQGQPDYEALDLPDPDEQPFDEWSWAERRAYLYREWLDHGTHQLMNKSQLAEQFGVSRDTLYNDLDKIAEFVEENMGRHHGAETTATYQTAVRELLDAGEYEKAARVQSMMGDWLERRGAVDKEPERREVKAAVAGADGAELDEEDLELLDGVF